LVFDKETNFFSCSYVRFRAEPFQILALPINQTDTTLEQTISRLTKIETVWKLFPFVIQ
jgi:hypothetical protein